MLCKNCNAVLDDDSMFCFNCGAKIVNEPEQTTPFSAPTFNAEPISAPAAPISEQKKSKFSVGKIIALILGTILIIIGVTRISDAGTSISSTSFGGDFYTYTYRGIVAISEQLASLEEAIGWVIVAIGASIDARALLK